MVGRGQRKLRRGFERLADIIGILWIGGVASWRANAMTMEAEREPHSVQQRCREPCSNRCLAMEHSVPPDPVTLPTYDEVAGRETDQRGYNDYIPAWYGATA